MEGFVLRILCLLIKCVGLQSYEFLMTLNPLNTMPSVDKGSKVLVSGANGYIAMWIVRTLLERGFTVRGTVRTEDKGKFLIEYFKSLGYGDKIEVVVVDDIVKVGNLN